MKLFKMVTNKEDYIEERNNTHNIFGINTRMELEKVVKNSLFDSFMLHVLFLIFEWALTVHHASFFIFSLSWA